ncbi:hypothetical protein JOD69_002662 [Methylocaldum sp. RMAD-M]|jgi:hypothetical protein|nr:hypothetical protein [Methylocaldum sp. RMAD-M]
MDRVRRPRHTEVPSVAPGAGRNAQDKGARRVAFGLAPSLALALRAPLAPKSAPGRFVFGSFLLATQRPIRRERIGTAVRWPERRGPRTDFAAYPACGAAPRSETIAALSGALVEFSNI